MVLLLFFFREYKRCVCDFYEERERDSLASFFSLGSQIFCSKFFAQNSQMKTEAKKRGRFFSSLLEIKNVNNQ